MVRAKSFLLPFLKRKQLTKDVHSFYFDRAAVDFDFLPGQYIQMRLPHQSPDVRGTTRYFTISSSPHEKHLMVTTKMVQSTFKETLHGLVSGQNVQFFGPMGWFLEPRDEQFEKVFLSGGIGITPFRSLLLSLEKESLSQKVTLIAFFSHKNNALFAKELKAVAASHPHITVVYSFSNFQENQNNDGDELGRISQTLLQKYVKDIQKPKYYLVGPMAMVSSTRNLLQKLSISDEKIFTEDFTGY